MVFRTRVIVRLGTQNRMVTKGYRKGVYDRVTGETAPTGYRSAGSVQTWLATSQRADKRIREDVASAISLVTLESIRL
jgi:hypothetical protein